MESAEEKAAVLAKQLHDVFQKTGGKPAKWDSWRADKNQGQKSRGGGQRADKSDGGYTANPAISAPLATSQFSLPASRSRPAKRTHQVCRRRKT
eukprot:6079768-Amphidinium_carterae.1